MSLEKISGDFHNLPYYHLRRRFAAPLISFSLGRPTYFEAGIPANRSWRGHPRQDRAPQGTRADSEQNLKVSRAEMPIIGERLGDAHPPHHDKRNVIHNAGGVSFAALVGAPRLPPIFRGRPDQRAGALRFFPQPIGFDAKRMSRGGVATFRKDEWRGDQSGPAIADGKECPLRGDMPLVVFIPQREQANRIHEDRAHGWCSL